MLTALAALALGLAVLVWSADRFVDGAAATARYAGLSPLVIGMVIVGFGTSAPEMVVSALAAFDNNAGLALGNAYGSNIGNIALILGLTALVSPMAVQSQVIRKELPLLAAITLLAGYQLLDGHLSRTDAFVLLGVFALLMAWTLRESRQQPADHLGSEVASEITAQGMSLRAAIGWLVIGLLLLIASSRLLVWGAVEIAQLLGISDLIIGLTIVAVGTSLPEMASSLIAARKGEHDIALGNIIGSNLFNTLVVVGIAAGIRPMGIPPDVLVRDWPVMLGITVLLFLLCYGFRGPARLNRTEGTLLLLCYVAYTGLLAWQVLHA